MQCRLCGRGQGEEGTVALAVIGAEGRRTNDLTQPVNECPSRAAMAIEIQAREPALSRANNCAQVPARVGHVVAPPLQTPPRTKLGLRNQVSMMRTLNPSHGYSAGCRKSMIARSGIRTMFSCGE